MELIAIWSMLGALATNFLVPPKTKKEAIGLLICLGPVCWVLGLTMYLRR